jgi:hypothetical protein
MLTPFQVYLQEPLLGTSAQNVLSVPRNFSCGREAIPSLAERGGGAFLGAYLSVGTNSLVFSVVVFGQVYSTLCIYSWSP